MSNIIYWKLTGLLILAPVAVNFKYLINIAMAACGDATHCGG